MGRRRSHRHNDNWLTASTGGLVHWALLSLAGIFAVCAVFVFVNIPERVTPSEATDVAPTFASSDPLVDPTVVFIGDSFTGGSDMGGNGDANWSSVAASQMGWSACTFGVGGSGWTRGSNDWTFGARVDWALSVRPSMIVFANGINDMKEADNGVIVSAADEALRYLRERDPSVPVVVLGTIKINDQQSPRIDDLDADLREIAESHGAYFIDGAASDWFADEKYSYIGVDNFHPTDEGHQYLAAKFVESMDGSGISLGQRPRSETGFCYLPRWQNTYPSGAEVMRTPAPTAPPPA
ncbi:SGNH/GDSL hydrolase family protein [Microbacterium sp. A1-JK]|uniref:SGNH/GDSL hydrolase family protein n=1 Tax=Microbacterium sp. A1-JK TaxID=3177516 RepID=UPI00388BA5F9